MSGSDGFPDPDLSFLEGTTGEDIAAVGRGLDDAAQQLDRKIGEIGDQAQTATVDRVLDALTGIKKGLDAAAAAANTAAAAFREMKQAWEKWKNDAPKQADLAAAEQTVEEASRLLREASEQDLEPQVVFFRKALKAAEAKRKDLFEKRIAEDAELAAALERAQAMLPGFTPPGDIENRRGTATPGTETPAPGPTPSTPGPGASAPGGELPGTSLPGATLPPGTGLSAMPETAGAATGSGLSPAQAGALAAALGQQQQQGQPQVAPPMPQMPAMPQQQQKPAENPLAKSLDDYDPNALLAALGPAGVLAGVGAPALSSTIASPALTPLTPAGPTFTPLNPTGLGGATPANPVVQPVVTGTSTAGLTTDSNVSGRADGTAARTATGTGPASHLAAGGAETAAARPTGMGTGAGMGAPMMPMGMPMQGGMNGMGGAGKDRDPVTAKLTPDQIKLLALDTIAEAVPGGTIAQRRDADVR